MNLPAIPECPVTAGTILRRYDGTYWLVIATNEATATLAAIALEMGVVAAEDLGDYFPVTSDDFAAEAQPPAEP